MRKPTTAVLAFIALALMACGATPKKDTITPGNAGTGAAATAAGAGTTAAPAGPKKFNVTEVGHLSLTDGSTGDVVVNSAKVQGKFIVANVTITCTAGKVSYNPFDWKAIAGDGTTLDFGFGDVKNTLNSGDLGAGQKITGNVIWEGTAAQLKGAQFQYEQGIDTLAYWVAP